MKTAVSLPDELFEEAERLARRLGKSRSRLYRDALAEYVTKHDPDDLTRRIDDALVAAGDVAIDPFVTAAARRGLGRVEW
jgi:metal-responsive CopG/Arc/MetJ family transcriptional regulator